VKDSAEIERLRKSEAKYRKMTECAFDAVFEVNRSTGVIEAANSAAVRMTGRERDDLIDTPAWDIHPREERETARAFLDKVNADGRGEARDLTLRRADGARLHLVVLATVIEFHEESIIQYICWDVSDRHKLERAQHTLSSYYEHILNSMPVGLAVRSDIDTKPRIQFENNTLREMFSLKNCSGVSLRWDVDAESQGGETRVILESGAYAEERSLPCNKVFLFTISYVRNVHDEWCELTVVQDITQRRQLEDELARLNEELEQKVRERTRELEDKQTQLIQAEKMASLGQLVAGVAHEINTPLAALASNNDLFIRSMNRLTDLLTDESIPSSVREDRTIVATLDNINHLNTINKTASERILGIVNTLRNFARLDQAEKDRVDIHDGIRSTLSLVQHELKGRIEVVTEFADVPPVLCYPNQLNQVFMNLLVNAAQAIDGKGTITIRTRVEGEQAVISIADSGSGISEENQKRIFDPGFTTKGSGVGTGLGLSIVHGIIADHGGGIEVTSKIGEGTTFTVYIPFENSIA
jgi:PAS domain S-box-containing protein